MAGTIRLSVAELDRLAQRVSPTLVRRIQDSDRLARWVEEHMVVINLAGALESGSKLQLRFQYLQRPRA